MSRSDWPAGRIVAVVGAFIGLLMALLLLGGVAIGVGFAPSGADIPLFAGLGVLGAVGVVHLVVSLLALGSGAYLNNNPRLHGALLVLWGIVGLFIGLGFWIGAVLVLIGGVLGLARAPMTGGVLGRRPAT